MVEGGNFSIASDLSEIQFEQNDLPGNNTNARSNGIAVSVILLNCCLQTFSLNDMVTIIRMCDGWKRFKIQQNKTFNLLLVVVDVFFERSLAMIYSSANIFKNVFKV